MAATKITPEMARAFDNLESKCLLMQKELTEIRDDMLRLRGPCVAEAARLASESVAAKFDAFVEEVQVELDKLNDTLNSLRPRFKYPVVLRPEARPDKKRSTH